MFGNYLTVALRNIVRHKLYSLINIAGLGIGISCAIFIILFIQKRPRGLFALKGRAVEA